MEVVRTAEEAVLAFTANSRLPALPFPSHGYSETSSLDSFDSFRIEYASYCPLRTQPSASTVKKRLLS